MMNALAYNYLWLGDIWSERNKEISSVSNENISLQPRAYYQMLAC